jgi:hypothetical protein
MNIQTLIQDFEEDIKLCWKSQGHEMLLWAKEWEKDHGPSHGLGDLNEPFCRLRPRQTCPACGRIGV